MLWRKIASAVTLIPIVVVLCIMLIFYVDKGVESLHRRFLYRARRTRAPRRAFQGPHEAPGPVLEPAETLERPESSPTRFDDN